MEGGPIRITDRAALAAHRGKLVSSVPQCTTRVHAAAFLRKREIVLETELLSHPGLLRLILVHEIFHFVWMRLGNRRREEFAEILIAEHLAGARGELGESACAKKELIVRSDRLRNSRAWRDYVCESFCDTAAWVYSGVKRNAAFTLGTRWRRLRGSWFRVAFEGGCRC